MPTLSHNELSDLYDAVHERIEDQLLPALTLANHAGNLQMLLELLGLAELMPQDGDPFFRPCKVLVIGDSMVQEGELRSAVRKKGLNIGDFEFFLGYCELKHFDVNKLRDTTTYKAVLAGPVPHSTQGKGNASSAIALMEAHPETYPPVIRITSGHELKISKKAFIRALDALVADA